MVVALCITVFVWNTTLLLHRECAAELSMSRHLPIRSSGIMPVQDTQELALLRADRDQALARLNEVAHDKDLALAALRADLDEAESKMKELEGRASRITSRPPSAPGYRPSEALVPVLVICHNRPEYLDEALQSIITTRQDATQFPIIVSQDGTHDGVWQLLEKKYADEVVAVQFQARHEVTMAKKGENLSYYYIAQHYFYALRTVFNKMSFNSVIILEDDLRISPDFFEYFTALLPLLHDPDENIYCISAWNDNGKSSHVHDPAALRRSDFFPGLGWMLTRELWMEFEPKWPEGYWDDWVRDPAQRKGRHCIFPEISRTYTYGAKGSSGGQFFNEHLQHIALNDRPQKFTDMDLSYLNLENWDAHLQQMLDEAPPDRVHSYTNHASYQKLARQFSLMSDEKAGIIRSSYNGIVWFWRDGDYEWIVPQ